MILVLTDLTSDSPLPSLTLEHNIEDDVGHIEELYRSESSLLTFLILYSRTNDVIHRISCAITNINLKICLDYVFQTFPGRYLQHHLYP